MDGLPRCLLILSLYTVNMYIMQGLPTPRMAKPKSLLKGTTWCHYQDRKPFGAPLEGSGTVIQVVEATLTCQFIYKSCF